MVCVSNGVPLNNLVLILFIQELLRSKQRVLEAASERGLLQKALLRPNEPPGVQVTGPYPNTNDQYPVECGPLTKEQIEQVRGKYCLYFKAGSTDN